MTTPEAENERRMREYIAAWNDHDPDAIVAFLAEDNQQFSAERLRTISEEWFSAFPDLRHEIEALAADGAWVLGWLELRGTHEDTFMGIPPTGTVIEVADHFATRFEDGLIAEHHATADIYALLGQLGVTLPPDGTAEEANKAVVRRYFAALNERDREAFREVLAADFTYGAIEGVDEMVEAEWAWAEAFDLHWEIEAMYADGSSVTTRLTVTGTHRDEHLGLEPTGESFEISAMTIGRVEDGAVVEWWGEWDFAGLLEQIGAIDAPVDDA